MDFGRRLSLSEGQRYLVEPVVHPGRLPVLIVFEILLWQAKAPVFMAGAFACRYFIRIEGFAAFLFEEVGHLFFSCQ